MKFHQIEGKMFCEECGRSARKLELFTSVVLHCDYCEEQTKNPPPSSAEDVEIDTDWWKAIELGSFVKLITNVGRDMYPPGTKFEVTDFHHDLNEFIIRSPSGRLWYVSPKFIGDNFIPIP